MVQFCTQFEEPIYYRGYEQQLAIGVDGASIDNENQLLMFYGDFLNINKVLIGSYLERPLYITSRLGQVFTPSGLHYVAIDQDVLNFPQNAKYIRYYIKNQYSQEVCSITYKIRLICKSKENPVLCWYNDLAGFDTFVFDGNMQIETAIKTVSSHFEYASRNKKTDKKTYDTIFQVSTKGVTEKQIKGLESLLISEEVYLFDIDNSYDSYKRVINDKLIPVSIDSTSINVFESQKGIYEIRFNCKVLEAYA